MGPAIEIALVVVTVPVSDDFPNVKPLSWAPKLAFVKVGTVLKASLDDSRITWPEPVNSAPEFNVIPPAEIRISPFERIELSSVVTRLLLI